ncbi:MAG: ester cyclase [Chloroflexota bacterium]
MVERFVDEIFLRGSSAAVDELIAPDARFHTYPFGDDPRGRDARCDRAGPGGPVEDVEFTVNDLVAEGDLVAARLTTAATQTGVFMKLPPTGKRAMRSKNCTSSGSGTAR